MRGYVFQFREVFQELPMLLDGAITTLHISILTLVFSLIVGIVGALCRMSRLGWLRVPATWYVEVVRNTPLLVQLFFIYFTVILTLPAVREASQFLGLPIYLTNRGLFVPSPRLTTSAAIWLAFLILGIIQSTISRSGV